MRPDKDKDSGLARGEPGTSFAALLRALCGEMLWKFSIGGAGGIRTPDLLDAIEARSQLRHGPTGSGNAEKL